MATVETINDKELMRKITLVIATTLTLYMTAFLITMNKNEENMVANVHKTVMKIGIYSTKRKLLP